MRRRARAFTAVEVTMVAAVIAILALIILPLFQKRADKARIAAAQGDLQEIAKAEMLAYADTSLYFRLQDLDNIPIYPGTSTGPLTDRDISVPYATWERALTQSEREVLYRRWQGPYIAMQNMASVRLGIALTNWSPQLQSAFFFNTTPIQNKHPILILGHGSGVNAWDSSVDSVNDKIPVDPWGSPYIFYAPASETDYNFGNGVVYSMGPNGAPGNSSDITSEYLQRPTDLTNQLYLGNGDDIQYVF
jgi:Tfp pilus assembly protein PilE